MREWLIAYDYSPSDGTDGTLDEPELAQPSSYVANKPRKKRIIRASRKLTAWNNAVPPRNLSADAVRPISLSTLLRYFTLYYKTIYSFIEPSYICSPSSETDSSPLKSYGGNSGPGEK